MDNLLCPLLVAQKEEGAVAQECRLEKCAWYVGVEAKYGKSGCAVLKLGAAAIKGFFDQPKT